MSNNSTNSKSYMIYRVVPFPTTYSDPNPDFKVTEFLQMPLTCCVHSWCAICLR